MGPVLGDWDRPLTDKMETLSSFWAGLAPGDKHLTEKSKWADFIASELLSRIKDPIRTMVDYGCGGGWVARKLDPVATIYLFDICQESLDAATARLSEAGFLSVFPRLIKSEPSAKDGAGIPAVDLLISLMVINHFPDLAYYNRVAAFWKTMRPKYLILHQRHADQTVGSRDFEDYQAHYGSGLMMMTEDVLAPFAGEYTEVYHTLESATFGKWNTPGYEFFILRRK